ncbi:MAG: SIS domain-containing protein [Minisyncoccales bacterium]
MHKLKGEYPHFMIKEIMEQDEKISQEIESKFPQRKVIFDGIDKIENRLLHSKKIEIIACGTSYHSGLIGKYLLEDVASFPAGVELASEFQYRNPMIDDDKVYLFISQSGETSDLLGALDLVKKSEALIIGITNVKGSSLSKLTDYTLYNQSGSEISIASTKVFTSQIMILLFLSLFLKEKRGGVINDALINDIIALPKIVKEVLNRSSNIKKIADEYKDFSNIIFTGGRYGYPIAMEGALKIKETSYVHAEAVPIGELRHGPIALIDRNLPVFVLAPSDSIRNRTLLSIEDLKKREANLIVLATDGDSRIDGLTPDIIRIPSVSEEVLPVVLSIPLQLFAYYLSAVKGLDPDNPRSLSKAVILE